MIEISEYEGLTLAERFCNLSQKKGHKIIGFSVVQNPDPQYSATNPLLYFVMVDKPDKVSIAQQNRLVSVLGSHQQTSQNHNMVLED